MKLVAETQKCLVVDLNELPNERLHKQILTAEVVISTCGKIIKSRFGLTEDMRHDLSI